MSSNCSASFVCYRVVLTFLNILYIIVACILIGVAGYAKSVAVIDTFSVMGGIIACGVFVLLIAIIGLIGALRHNQVLLFFYMIILFLVFLAQFALACVCLGLSSSQQKKLFHVGWVQATKENKEMLQNRFRCCGFDNSSEDSDPVPCPGECCSTMLSTLPVNGTTTVSVCKPCSSCWEAVGPLIDQILKAVGGIGLFFSFTEILGVSMTVGYRNLKDPRANPNAFL